MKQIYVHGLGQTPDSWERIVAQLAAAGNRVCPDLSELVRGNEVSYKNLYAAFSDVCSKGEEPIDLCGLSLGGVLALNYAIDHPQKVNSLVLIAAPYKMPKKWMRFQNLIFHLMPKCMFPKVGFTKAAFLHLCKTMMELDFSKSLEKVACPTLIICGEKDSANRDASEEMARILGNAELQIVSGAGHEVNLEAPEELAEVLRRFYAKIG